MSTPSGSGLPSNPCPRSTCGKCLGALPPGRHQWWPCSPSCRRCRSPINSTVPVVSLAGEGRCSACRCRRHWPVAVERPAQRHRSSTPAVTSSPRTSTVPTLLPSVGSAETGHRRRALERRRGFIVAADGYPVRRAVSSPSGNAHREGHRTFCTGRRSLVAIVNVDSRIRPLSAERRRGGGRLDRGNSEPSRPSTVIVPAVAVQRTVTGSRHPVR